MKQFVLLVVVAFSMNLSNAQVIKSVQNISQLEVTDRINVSLVLSDENKVEVYGSLADDVEIIQSGSTLRIKMRSGKILQGEEVDVKVAVPSLISIVARKGAQVQQSSGILEADMLTLISSEGARIISRIEATNLTASMNTGGIIEVSGKSTVLTTKALAGGNFFGKDLHADNVVARTNAGGKCVVNANKAIDAQTRAGGVIEIFGNPSDRKEKKVAGGRIDFM